MTTLDKIRAINGIVGERLPMRVAVESIRINDAALERMLTVLREEMAKIEQIAAA